MSTAESTGGDESRLRGWLVGLRRARPLWVTAATGIVLLVSGLLLGHYAFAAPAEPTPEAGLVTVPVGYGSLENIVTVRGQVGYADSLEVNLDASALTGPAVVTGHVPAVGAPLDALSIALEVGGRPLIVLPGSLAAYRSLGYGMSGPDVVQFKTAMRSIGIDAGDPGDPLFDETAAAGVAALYSMIGYTPPESGEDLTAAVRTAESTTQAAEDALAQARIDLHEAQSGATAVDILAADNAVKAAQRSLDTAKNAQPVDGNAVADLQDALDLAKAERQALNTPQDTRTQQLAVTSATRAVDEARTAATQAKQDALPILPLSEVLYMGQLPARAEAVDAKLGAVLAGPAMTISGATLGLTGSIDPGDAKLLTVGGAASFDIPGGETHGATVSAITPGATAADRPVVTIAPDALSAEQVTALAGQNVVVSVPVGATSGKVLSVPVAALSAGPGGETRVQVVDGDPRDGQKATTRLVTVETGLAAQGQVEVIPKAGQLDKGDLVVVSR